MTQRTFAARCIAATFSLAMAGPVLAYDLMQAWQDALANDSQVASARAELAALRERVPQARAGLLPQVGASASINRSLTDTNLAPTRNYTGQNYGIQLSYPLYRLQNVELVEQSKLQAALGETLLGLAQQDLIVRVAQLYFDVLAAQDNVATIQSQKRAITEQLAAAKRNFEVGTATITDQQEAQARFDLAVAQELAAQNELEVRRAALAQLVGRPVGELDILRPGAALKPPEPARESDWVDSARRDAWEVQQAELSREIARREIDRQRYARSPTVDVVGSLSHSRNSQASAVGVRANNAAVGLQLAIPLYTGGLIDSRVREAAAYHDQALADLETVRRGTEQAARQAFLGLNSGLAQVRALEAAERSSQLALDSNLLGYQVGVRINIDVLNAQQQLFTTRRDLARARYDVLINGLRLKSTTGELSEDDLRAVNALLVDPANRPRN
ncbi:MAG: TolC family outer membrane protein [Burkholderiaceae bacterium]